ncbi:MFS transporter [Micromonospora sicca]|uniref:MFS transporter n=1 Tax=Micromonospora sicca TaxID=2202420 RepID=UPI0021074DEE|nr:MFS transporter [Micromonospora sp. 4G51]
MLLGGALGDRYGRRRIFLVGIAGFTIASIMCAVVPTMSSLIVARILQGIGGPRRSLRSEGSAISTEPRGRVPALRHVI